MKVFVLAAGYATRLYPLTRDRAKPLLDVAGAPILTHILRRITTLRDVSQIAVIANHRFQADFSAWQRAFRSPAPVRVLDDGSSAEENRLGALGDLAFALREVPLEGEEWRVVAGDNLLAFDLAPAQRVFLARRSPLLLLREVEHGPGPTRYNEVTLDTGGRVARFREKPSDPSGVLAAIALYFFTPQVGPLVERYLAEGGERDAPGHFVAWLVEQTPVFATQIAGPWFDIGSHESLADARARFPQASA